jgi:hypothetical protein
VAYDPEPAERGSGPRRAAHSQAHSIFRPEAIRHYKQSQNRIVFPRFTTPRVLNYLWVLAGIFTVLGFYLAFRALFPAG